MTTIAGYTYDADMYCKACARSEGMTESGATDSEGNEPYPVFYYAETDGQYHCGNGSDCVDATTEHEYRHDLPIGAPIRCTPLTYAEEPDGVSPVDWPETPELIQVETGSFLFRYEVELTDEGPRASHYETINRGTAETEYAEPSSRVDDYLKNWVAEHERELTDDLTEN